MEELKLHSWTNTANSYAFTYVTVLGIDLMYLCSPNFASMDTTGPAGSSDTLLAANVTAPYASILEVSMPAWSWFTVPAMTTSQLHFQLRDRYYSVLDIVPNISFVLLID